MGEYCGLVGEYVGLVGEYLGLLAASAENGLSMQADLCALRGEMQDHACWAVHAMGRCQDASRHHCKYSNHDAQWWSNTADQHVRAHVNIAGCWGSTVGSLESTWG